MANRIKRIEKLNNTTYKFKIGKDNYDDDVIIGDEADNDFKPKVKLSRWKWGRYPAEIDISLITGKDEIGTHRKDKEKVKWETPDFDYHIYGKEPLEEESRGELEIELFLKKKPDTNVFEWELSAPDLDFFYQPELTQEEIDEGSFRPENVVGSYAVYHKTACDAHKDPLITPDNLRIDGMKSKAFHIYRPKIIDADGNKIWGELNYINGILSVTIPQEFLDTAIYPINIDPNFGYETKGGTELETNGTRIHGTTDTGASGTLDSITAYSKQLGANTPEFRHALYERTGVGAGDLVSGSPTEAWTMTGSWDGWKTLDCGTPPTISAIDYYICIWGSGPGYLHYYDAGPTNNLGLWNETYPNWPSSLTSFGNRDWQMSIYATYTVVAGSSTTSTSTSTSTSSSTSSSTTSSTTSTTTSTTSSTSTSTSSSTTTTFSSSSTTTSSTTSSSTTSSSTTTSSSSTSTTTSSTSSSTTSSSTSSSTTTTFSSSSTTTSSSTSTSTTSSSTTTTSSSTTSTTTSSSTSTSTSTSSSSSTTTQ